MSLSNKILPFKEIYINVKNLLKFLQIVHNFSIVCKVDPGSQTLMLTEKQSYNKNVLSVVQKCSFGGTKMLTRYCKIPLCKKSY